MIFVSAAVFASLCLVVEAWRRRYVDRATANRTTGARSVSGPSTGRFPGRSRLFGVGRFTYLVRVAGFGVLLLSFGLTGCGADSALAGRNSPEPVLVRAVGRAEPSTGVIRSLALTEETSLGSALTPGDGPAVGAEAITGQAEAEEQAPAPAEPTSPPGTIVAHAVVEQVAVHVAPSHGTQLIHTFDNPTTQNGPLVFQAIGPAQDGWLEVLLPIRPNGSTGWVKTEDVALTLNPYLIEVDASAYELRIFRYGQLEFTTPVAIGTGDTPTPIGNFYLVELLQPSSSNGPYGSYAYGLSGYSDTLESFNGGEGVIGIHGTNRPELLGQNVSHGCIRVANPAIEEMVGYLPLGTPVHISA